MTSSNRRRSAHPFPALAAAAALLIAGACSDSPTGPGGSQGGDLLVVTSIADQSGTGGSSFVQTVDLDQASVNNAGAWEQTFYPYASIHGDDVIVTQHLYGDQMVRYVRGGDGQLTEAGRMNLPPGSLGSSVVYASSTKAYVALTYAGRILIFDPRTMTPEGEIDLTTLGIARNPGNPDDRNPEPATLHIRDGRLYVGLQQLVTAFASADGADIAIFDVATDTFEKVIHDPRTAAPGRYGYNDSMFVDEAGDLYVYAVASFGFVPGQTGGILRIRAGETEFDPDYFVDISDAEVDVPGGRVSFMNGFGYGGGGWAYAIAEVPAMGSNPPNYAADRNFQPVRIHLATGAIEVLPLPASNGIASGVTRHGDHILFGLSTVSGVGIYRYDPTTGTASTSPVVSTVGDPTHVLAFD